MIVDPLSTLVVFVRLSVKFAVTGLITTGAAVLGAGNGFGFAAVSAVFVSLSVAEVLKPALVRGAAIAANGIMTIAKVSRDERNTFIFVGVE